MPIIGLTDNIAPTFPEIGKVRKGAKRSGKGPGKDLRYFRFTSDRPEVEAAFYAVYPQRPVRINVVLPHDTAGENFTAWQEEWGASITLKHRCDGVHVVRRWNDATGEYEDFPEGEGPPCPYTISPEQGGKFRTREVPGCQITGRLTVVIPELVAAGYVGYVTVLTGAKHDVRSILCTLAKMEEERRKSGQTLAWLPFTLERVEEEISSPAWENEPVGKRHKVKKSLLKLTPAEEWVRAQVERARRDYLALPEPTEIAEAEAMLTQGRALLHGDAQEGDWDEIIEENGNGNSPASEPEVTASGGNGNESQAAPSTTPDDTALRTKWAEYYAKQWAEAQALHLEAEPLAKDGDGKIVASTAEVRQAAADLAEQVKRAKALARWRELWDKARTLGLEPKGITEDMPYREIVKRGKALAKDVEKAETEIPA
jgi:hypothetical protein